VTKTLITPAIGTEPKTVRAAAIALADRSTGRDDLLHLLEVCGLIEAPPARPINSDGRTVGRCPSCRRIVRLALTGLLNAHYGRSNEGATRCPGGGKGPVAI
jgi:hypothetical protein